MNRSADVIVVGGGIAGSAPATVPARDGYEVLVLERQTGYRDRVRGAAISARGVRQAGDRRRRPAVDRRRRLGIELHQTTPRTIAGGMPVDGVHAWPSPTGTSAVSGCVGCGSPPGS